MDGLRRSRTCTAEVQARLAVLPSLGITTATGQAEAAALSDFGAGNAIRHSCGCVRACHQLYTQVCRSSFNRLLFLFPSWVDVFFCTLN